MGSKISPEKAKELAVKFLDNVRDGLIVTDSRVNEDAERQFLRKMLEEVPPPLPPDLQLRLASSPFLKPRSRGRKPGAHTCRDFIIGMAVSRLQHAGMNPTRNEVNLDVKCGCDIVAEVLTERHEILISSVRVKRIWMQFRRGSIITPI